MKILLCVLCYIIATTYSAEYMINRSESDLLVAAFIALQFGLIYFLIYKPIKTVITK